MDNRFNSKLTGRLKIAMLSIPLFCVSCHGQDTLASEKHKIQQMITTDKFDIDQYKKNADATGWYVHTNERGDSIKEIAVGDNGYYKSSILKATPCYEINEEYYNTGALRSKGMTIMNGGPKTGIWQYFDEQGRLLKEDNEDNKFGKFGPSQLLAALEKEHLINTQTGEGKEYVLGISYEGSAASGRWKVLYSKSLPAIEHTYIFDGATGQLISHTNAKGVELR